MSARLRQTVSQTDTPRESDVNCLRKEEATLTETFNKHKVVSSNSQKALKEWSIARRAIAFVFNALEKHFSNPKAKVLSLEERS